MVIFTDPTAMARVASEDGTFVVEADGEWTFEFYLGLRPGRDRGDFTDPYLEGRHISLMGKIIHLPVRRKLEPSTQVDLTFKDDLNDVEDRARRHRGVLGVGAFTVEKSRANFSLHLPSAIMAPLMLALDRRKWRFIAMTVETPHLREGRMRTYDFLNEYDPADF